MFNILEHVCTIFTVNSSTNKSFLKIFLDAKNLKKKVIHATLNSKHEITICAVSKSMTDSEIVKRYIKNVLTLPDFCNVNDVKIILLNNGLLLINVLCKTYELFFTNNNQKNNKLSYPEEHRYSTTIAPEKSNFLAINQLENHQTIRNGNKLKLIIPLDDHYKSENIKINVVNSSVCITATRFKNQKKNSNTDKITLPHIIQRTFYKEYEASDCVPDPNSISYKIEKNYLYISLNVIFKNN